MEFYLITLILQNQHHVLNVRLSSRDQSFAFRYTKTLQQRRNLPYEERYCGHSKGCKVLIILFFIFYLLPLCSSKGQLYSCHHYLCIQHSVKYCEKSIMFFMVDFELTLGSCFLIMFTEILTCYILATNKERIQVSSVFSKFVRSTHMVCFEIRN